MLTGVSFRPVTGYFPDQALGPESAVKFRIHAFATAIDVQALAAFPAIPLFVLAADCGGLTIRMICTLHFSVSFQEMPGTSGGIVH
jgi:hypothetical protein